MRLNNFKICCTHIFLLTIALSAVTPKILPAETIRLKTGKVIDGKITDFSDDGVKIETPQTVYNIPYKYMDEQTLSAIKQQITDTSTKQKVVDTATGTESSQVSDSPETAPASPQINPFFLLMDYKEKEEYKQSIAALLLKKDFTQLDKIADGLRVQKSRFSSGSWKLEYFYQGLSSSFDEKGIGKLKEYIDILNQWQKTVPSSLTAPVALIDAYVDLAWEYRGAGYVSTVTEDGVKNFKEYLAKA